MNELDPRARAFIDAAQNADAPSPATCDRVKRAVLLEVAAIGAAASTLTGAAAAGTMSLSVKAGVAVLAVSLVAGAGVGAVKWQRARQGVRAAAEVAERAPAHPLHRTERVADELLPAQPAKVAAPTRLESKQRRADSARRSAALAPEEVIAETRLNDEVAVLNRAREALGLGRPAQALRILAEYDRLFGKGALGEERQAMAAIARCQVQPGPAARQQAERFARSSPTSPLLERVRAACITTPVKD